MMQQVIDNNTDNTIFLSHQPYPVKLVSRSLPAGRTTRLRLSWFTLGMVASLLFHAVTQYGGNIASTPIAMPADMPEAAVQQRFTAETPPSVPQAEIEVVAAEPETKTAASVEPATPAKTAAPTASTTVAQLPMKLTLTLEKGDTLSTVLDQLGVASAETHEVVQAIRKHYNPKNLAVGQDINVHLDKSPADVNQPIVKSLEIPLSVISSLEVVRKSDEQFLVQKHDAKIKRKPVHVAGTITSSLYETGTEHGIPVSMIGRIINAYSYDVDFQREIRNGDHISVLFEQLKTEEGKNAGYGDILYAKLLTGNKIHTIYRYVDSNGDADFYNNKGESVRKGLLRTPINGARITSRYGMRRHPILGYSKMHQGVDFGAATGTPIYAAGNGVVDYAARKGGYGNYLRIKHNGTYSTAYAHIHRFASGIRSGKKVKQGQVVAYVGSTGRSTGPHLHYEVLKYGKQVNPSGVKFQTGTKLKGTELAAFKQQMAQVNNTIAALEAETNVALLADQ